MLIGVVGGILILAIKVHHADHYVDPSFHRGEENSKIFRSEKRREVILVLHPISAQVQAVMLGNDLEINIVTVVPLVLEGLG